MLGSKFPTAYIEEDDDDEDEQNEKENKDSGIITKPLSKIFITPLLKKITQITQPASVSNSTTIVDLISKSITSVQTKPVKSTTKISSSTVKQTNKKRFSSLTVLDRQKAQDEIEETNEEDEENNSNDQENETSSSKITKGQDFEYNDDSDVNQKSNQDNTDYEDASNNNENSNQPDYKRMCVVTNWLISNMIFNNVRCFIKNNRHVITLLCATKHVYILI